MSPTMFAAPSPTGRNNAQLFLTKGGVLVDRHGRSWGRSSIRKMALDAALPGPEWNERSDGVHSRLTKLMAELKSLVEEGDLEPALHKKLTETLARHVGELGRADGAGARDDDDKGEGAIDDAAVEQRVREYLRGKGLDDESIEEALEKVKLDRAEARDRLPVPATKGGMGGYRSGRSKHDAELDLTKEFPGIEYTTRDVYGEPNSERLERDADPAREAGVRAAERLPGGGTSRRLSNDAAPVRHATDADLAKEYPGIENVVAIP